MNEAMRALLVERLKLQPEEVAMVQAGDPSPIIARQVRDPALAGVLTSMLRRPAETEPVSQEPTAQQRLERALEETRRLRQDLAAADAMLKYVADVFGACHACWGRAPGCARCGGHGHPGARVPLEEDLLAWVGPALRRLHLRVVRATA
ncbi:MAG TPA: hypothetical protein VJU87_01300 [Gemmatimonadaceae bacterium]|nr:hypothetical protein [Gemmatimonadaceae bacterium]